MTREVIVGSTPFVPALLAVLVIVMFFPILSLILIWRFDL